MINPQGPERIGQSPWFLHGYRCLSFVPTYPRTYLHEGGGGRLNLPPKAACGRVGTMGLGVLRPGIKDGQRGAEGRAPAEGDASELAARVREFRKMTGGLRRVVRLR